jgi:phospholipid/cholesterol/gamma-HCH transport system substrate-binding protein
MRPPPRPARLIAPLALLVAVIALAVVLLSSNPTYVLHARFYDAGQLVSGDLVTVGGHQVGSVGAITLSGNGLADVELDISDSTLTPLRRGTIATIGQTSLTGVANRFVSLSPGVGARLPSGSVLSPEQTRGIVDLDTLLDTLTPRVRASLVNLLRSGAYLVAQPTASQFNRGIGYSNAAFSQTAQLGWQLAANRRALVGLVSATGRLSRALAAHSQQLRGAVHQTATVLREVASRRSALADAITRAPGVLGQGTKVLRHLGTTLGVLDPALLHLRPVAVRLNGLVHVLLPAVAHVLPTIQALSALVPGAEAALEGFPPVEKQALPAVQSLTTLLKLISPSLSALRPYAPDVVAGFFNGVGGSNAGAYDANGHYLHGEIAVQGGGESLAGLLNALGAGTAKLGPFHGGRPRLFAPCPGGGGPPAADHSNPWTTPDLLPNAGTLCKPRDDQR